MSTQTAVEPTSGVQRSRRGLNRDFARIALDLLPLADFVGMLGAGYLATWIYGTWIAHAGSAADYWAAYSLEILSVAVVAPLVLHDRRKRYTSSRVRAPNVIRRTILRYCALVGVALGLAFLSRSVDSLPRSLALLWAAFGLMSVLGVRLLLVTHLRLLERHGLLTESVAVVGAGPLADRLVRQLQRARPDSVKVVGVFDDRQGDGDGRFAACAFRPAGTVGDLVNMGKSVKLDWIVVAMPGDAEGRLHSTLDRLKALSVPVGLCPQNIGLELPFRIVDYVGDGLPVTILADRPIRRWNAVIKSGEDMILGGLITLSLLPLMGLIALAVRLDSPGPVLFRQRRHSADNDEFEVFKFRTMRWEPRAAGGCLRQTAIDDDRITPLGRFLRKTSLDELPQLFNVLRGDMSLVGPRPHAVDMRTEQRLGHEIIGAYPHRHRVKPGMTGWAQVNGSRGATETVEQLRRRVELDLHYVENWSLSFDLKILLMTFWVVFRGTNAR